MKKRVELLAERNAFVPNDQRGKPATGLWFFSSSDYNQQYVATFYEQNNSFTHASRFFVNFFARFCTTAT